MALRLPLCVSILFTGRHGIFYGFYLPMPTPTSLRVRHRETRPRLKNGFPVLPGSVTILSIRSSLHPLHGQRI
jgi:hypothetical protein